MATLRNLAIGVLAPIFLAVCPAYAEALLWGIEVEQLEYRIGEETNVGAWDFDAFVGTDEFKAVWRSEAEFGDDLEAFETLENQLRVQVPVTTFFYAVAGVRVDTPEDEERVFAVLGLHGLAPQWFEIDADLFISDHPAVRFEAEYEGLITNRMTLTPSVEIDVPFADDAAFGEGGFGPKLEVGLRLSYDLVDRAISPYIGVHYERVFGESSLLAQADGEDPGAVFFVAGVRLRF